jgi:hypothetical protein
LRSSRSDRVTRILLKVLYWAAVLAISLALLVGLVLYFESRDQSALENGGVRSPAPAVSSA